MRSLVLAIFTISLVGLAFANSNTDACKRYEAIKMGTKLQDISQQLGKGKPLAPRVIKNYIWKEGHYTFQASFENDKFTYANFYGWGGSQAPQKFQQAEKGNYTQLKQYEEVLGKPSEVKTTAMRDYEFDLTKETKVTVMFNDKNKVIGKTAGIYCGA